jgi:hypothetical protein
MNMTSTLPRAAPQDPYAANIERKRRLRELFELAINTPGSKDIERLLVRVLSDFGVGVDSPARNLEP